MQRFDSKIFKVVEINIGGTKELVVVGGRDKFPLLKDAFEGIKQIGVIGWGSQGPAQAQNLRDSLVGTDVKVKVGLREGSSSMKKAMAAGFTKENGTLGEMFDVIGESDMIILLISDAGQVEDYERIFATMKRGAILGLSHGFLLGYFESIKKYFPEHINVIGVCPKGMGPSVRALYEQGKTVNGAGINCSFAVEQQVYCGKEYDGRMTNVALGWAVALGAPYIFQTTLQMEYRSDIFGERGVLLGGVHGMVEALYRHFINEIGMTEEEAYRASVENVTGPLSTIISKRAITDIYHSLPPTMRAEFENAYFAAYAAYFPLLSEIYDEVSSGNEIRSVVMAGERLKEFPMGSIEGTRMWEVGKKVRADRKNNIVNINPTTAGTYCAMMMAQIDILLAHGHCISEVCNESVIEAVDSLNAYMHARGVGYMVDNCSTTARLGTRKWGPRFDHITMQQVLTEKNHDEPERHKMHVALSMHNFEGHPIHDALKVCQSMRPSVDIFVA